MALSKTGRFLSKAEISGVGVFSPLSKNPFPKTVLDPPTYDTFSPPVCFRPVVFLRGNRHRPGKSHFLRPPKLVLEGALYGTFSPPKIARYVLPPH